MGGKKSAGFATELQLLKDKIAFCNGRQQILTVALGLFCCIDSKRLYKRKIHVAI